jgi:hypothetical protein
LEYLDIVDLELLTQEEEPTFPSERRQEAINLRDLGGLVSEIHGWKVALELFFYFPFFSILSLFEI